MAPPLPHRPRPETRAPDSARPPGWDAGGDPSVWELANLVAARVAAQVSVGTGPAVPRLYTVSQAADLLSVHPNTVRNLISDGSIVPTGVTPRAVRVSSDQLRAFIRRRTGAG